MARCIDLNCDMGEGFDSDATIIAHVTSINIACGYHAGDPSMMRRTIQLAIDHGVAIGAHPGLPDRANFGRLAMDVSPQEVYDMVLYQAGALSAFARAADASVSHLKPHGALYNMAAKDAVMAEAIAVATRDFDPGCILVGLAGSELIRAGENARLKTASEAFADRTYQDDGSLTLRSSADALIHDPAIAAERVLKMVTRGTVITIQGTELPLRPDTVCIHGDSPGAVELAQTIRRRLEQQGIAVRNLAGSGEAKGAKP